MTATTLPAPAAAEWRALGVDVRLVVTEPAALDAARELLAADLAALDLACSRFRPDSEVSRLAAEGAGEQVVAPVGDLLADALAVALEAARTTDGAVDPTLGTALVDLGYDRDLAELTPLPGGVTLRVVDAAAWRRVGLERDPDGDGLRVRLPAGVLLDLGATAKAFGADRSAARIAETLGCGVLVCLGGDVAVAGPAPEGGWAVGVAELPGGADAAARNVVLTCGGLATSGTRVRRWSRGGNWLHHLLDPATGLPARSPWRTVTVAAATCAAANVATTATMVKGEAGLAWLRATGLPGRLVAEDGTVVRVNGWPADV